MYESLANNKFHVTERIQLRHESLIIYNQIEYDSNCRKANRYDLHKNKEDKITYSGNVTFTARKRITQAVHKLLMISPPINMINPISMKRETFTVNFITLTIPLIEKMIDAKEGYEKLLAPFLRTMKRKYNLKSYIWKAELQNRGQLHYHIIGNIWINWTNIRYEWNYLLSMNNYMDEYKLKYGNTNPNSIDVHKIYKIRNVANYLCKYIAKDVKKSKEGESNIEVGKNNLNGKVWDCSLDIKKFKLPTIDMNNDVFFALKDLEYTSKITNDVYDTCSIIKPIKCELIPILPKSLQDLNKEFINNIKSVQNESKIE